MTTASKKPPEFGPVREYKAHFELWDEAAIDDTDAPPFANGRRVWTTPVLSTTPLAAPKRRKPAPAQADASASAYWTVATVAVGALLAVLVMRPWKSTKAPAPPMKIAARPAMKVHASPKAMPSVAIPARQAVAAAAKAPVAVASKVSAAAPAKVAVAAPLKPAAMPSTPASAKPQAVPPLAAQVKPAAVPLIAAPPPRPVTMASRAAPIKPAAEPSSPAPPVKVVALPVVKPVAKPVQAEPTTKVPLESPSAADEEEEDEFAPVRALLLESSIKNQLTSAGYPSLGVSVTGGGDVFLNGTFLNLTDEDRMLAMVRGHKGVRDIYFSGTVWHDVTGHPEQATAPPGATAKANAASASPPSQPLPAKPPVPAHPPVPSAHGKIAHSMEFPVTAAEMPAISGRSAYAPSPAQPSSAAQTRTPSADSPKPGVDESGGNPSNEWDASLPIPKPIVRSTP
jgi:hypothetical protein